MKYLLFISVVIIFILIIAIFSPIPKIIDNLLVSEQEIILWKQYAIDGNMTATSKLISYAENKKEKSKWNKLYKNQRKKREREYKGLKKKSEEGNTTATLKIRELQLIGYF